MLRLFQQDQSLISLFILLFIATTIIFIPTTNESINTLPLLGEHIEIHWNAWFSKIAATGLIIIIAACMVRLNVVFNFIRVRTYFPALFYVFLVFPVTRGNSIEPVMFASLGLLAIFFTIFHSFKQKGISYNYFYAGLILGLINALYAPSLIFIVLIYISYGLLRQPNWRELIYPVVGVVIVFYALWGIFYIFDLSFSHFTAYFNNLFTEHKTVLNRTIIDKVFLGISGLLIIISSIHTVSRFMNMKIYARRYYLIFWCMFILCVVLFFLIPEIKNEIIYLIAIPCSFLFSHYFSNVRPVILNRLLFFIFIVTAIITVYIE
ncbi:MAG: hypothetical protein GVY19_06960 [Bacteroidetes bacterium]|jgi:hypothetical protein|nr:hypothetical protein [Bacteroidota bacterium]